MPNILKNFLKPAVHSYIFPEAEEILLDEPEEELPEVADPPPEETPMETEESQGAAAISFAQVQAEQIIADARKQADEQLSKRKAEAEDEIWKAREEAKSEGYRQGYAEGLQQARVESQSVIQQHLEKQAQEVADFLEKASDAREELIQ